MECILMANRLPVVLLTNRFVVFSMGQVLQRLVQHRNLSGPLSVCNVRVACTRTSLRFFGRWKVIIGGKVKNAFRRSELRKVTC